jgi:hypothetical protein
MGQPVDFPNKSRSELKELALKAARGEIYVAWTQAQVENSFGMFLALASGTLAEEYNMDTIGYVYTTKPKAHDPYRGMNNHPIYWSGAFVSRHDSPILWREFVKLQERMDEPSWLRRNWKKHRLGLNQTVKALQTFWKGLEYMFRPRRKEK